MLSDPSDQPTKMPPDFDPAWRLARAKNDSNRAGVFGIIDVDRQEAPFVIVSIEQRQLLMTMNGIAGLIDIKSDGVRRAFVASSPLVNQSLGKAYRIA